MSAAAGIAATTTRATREPARFFMSFLLDRTDNAHTPMKFGKGEFIVAPEASDEVPRPEAARHDEQIQRREVAVYLIGNDAQPRLIPLWGVGTGEIPGIRARPRRRILRDGAGIEQTEVLRAPKQGG